MSVTFMENFNFTGVRNADGSTTAPSMADIRANFKRRGGDAFTADSGILSGMAVGSETEAAGLDAHTFLTMTMNTYAGLGSASTGLGVPVTWENGVYFGFRLRLPVSANGVSYFYAATAPTPVGSTLDLINFRYSASVWYVHIGNNTTFSGSMIVPAGEWITVEVFRDSAGKVSAWINDTLLRAPTYTSTLPATNSVYRPFIYFGPKRMGEYTQGSVSFDVSDMYAVDPTITPGPVYRLGSSVRVATVPLTADVIAQWSLPAGAPATTHGENIQPYRATQSPLEVVDSTVIGARDQFSLGAVPKLSSDAALVGAIQVERMASNTGGAAHVISMEMDAGGGVKETAAVTVPAAAGFVYGNEVLQLNPDGAGWTLANVPTTKVGFSVKS